MYGSGYNNSEDVLYSYADEVIYATIEGDAVGFITFTEHDWESKVFIRLGYVQPEHREKGIHTALHMKLREIVRERGFKYIQNGVGTDNETMHEHVKSLGMEPVGIIYQYKVEEGLNATS